MLMLNKKLRQLFTFLAFFAIASETYASDYQNGLIAYINGDHSLAQKHWLSGAQKKDAKSMFNLGLLHEQAKVSGASIEKAMNWFSLAHDNGYPAAAYHMAQRMLDRGGSDGEAIGLINSAAEQGYAPAQRYLGIPLGSEALSSRPDASFTIAQETSTQANKHDFAWILRQPSDNWTIQLLAFTDKSKVERFVEKHGLRSNAAYYTEKVNGEVFYKLVYGSFNSKDKADFARQNLGPGMTEHGPWLRQWASVHKALK